MDIVKNRFPSAWSDLGPLVLRVVLGLIFAWHGYDKVFVKGTPAIAGFLGSLGIPLPDVMVYFLAYGELIGGILLILGLLTFWVSLVDIVIATVAFLTVHMTKGFVVSDGGYEFIILIFAASVSLLVSGAGRYSIDALISKKSVPSV
jgi:putative oxidoreductase